MLEKVNNIRDRFRDWFVVRSQGPYALRWLGLISFIESFIFPIPTVLFQGAYLMVQPRRWVKASLIVSIFSVLGGIVGYFLGAVFFEAIGSTIITTFHYQDEFASVQNLYEQYSFWAVLIGAFTPLPYKVFTLSAGFLSISFLPFVLASIVGRTLQFFIVGFFAQLFGPHAAKLIYNYFAYFVIIVTILVVIVLLVL